MKFKKPVKKCVNCDTLWKTQQLKDMSKIDLFQLLYDVLYNRDCFKAGMMMCLDSLQSKIYKCPSCIELHNRDTFSSREAHIKN